MELTIREYQETDLEIMIPIWNQVVDDGIAFPQTDPLSTEEAKAFFASQSFTGVAEYEGEVVGIYILHPNNEGRCGHICNASYAVDVSRRGMHIGENLVDHCLNKAHELGFRILQFNAVVRTNYAAIHLYEKMGFQKIGMIPGGFQMKDGYYEDIYLYYCQV